MVAVSARQPRILFTAQITLQRELQLRITVKTVDVDQVV